MSAGIRAVAGQTAPGGINARRDQPDGPGATAREALIASRKRDFCFKPDHADFSSATLSREMPAGPSQRRPRQPRFASRKGRQREGAIEAAFVGNCVATRAMPLVFEAMKRLPEDCCELTVVGGGAALEDWKARVANSNIAGRVTFTGAVPYAEVARYYAKADAFVFSRAARIQAVRACWRRCPADCRSSVATGAARRKWWMTTPPSKSP